MPILAVLLLFVFAILVIIFAPLISIWSLNLLFGLTIPYTLKTWFATAFLSGVLGGPRFFSTTKKD